MPRQKRRTVISHVHRAAIERQAELLRLDLSDAQRSLTPFEGHYNAISDFEKHLTVMLNLLNNRPAEYTVPHRAPMSGG